MTTANEGSGAPPLATPTRLVIDRSRWLRGEGLGELLRRLDGKMCCLGFLGAACGVPKEAMLGRGTPEESSFASAFPDWLMVEDDDDGDGDGFRLKDGKEVRLLVDLNDNVGGPDAGRESAIARVFAEHGVEVVFVDSMEQPRAAPPDPPEIK